MMQILWMPLIKLNQFMVMDIKNITKNVIDVFRGNAEPTTDGREGLRLIELLTACHIAAKDQTTVNLPINFSQ